MLASRPYFYSPVLVCRNPETGSISSWKINWDGFREALDSLIALEESPDVKKWFTYLKDEKRDACSDFEMVLARSTDAELREIAASSHFLTFKAMNDYLVSDTCFTVLSNLVNNAKFLKFANAADVQKMVEKFPELAAEIARAVINYLTLDFNPKEDLFVPDIAKFLQDYMAKSEDADMKLVLPELNAAVANMLEVVDDDEGGTPDWDSNVPTDYSAVYPRPETPELFIGFARAMDDDETPRFWKDGPLLIVCPVDAGLLEHLLNGMEKETHAKKFLTWMAASKSSSVRSIAARDRRTPKEALDAMKNDASYFVRCNLAKNYNFVKNLTTAEMAEMSANDTDMLVTLIDTAPSSMKDKIDYEFGNHPDTAVRKAVDHVVGRIHLLMD